MKISHQYIFRTVAGEFLIIPTGEAALRLRGLLCLNESGALLFQLLQQGCQREALLRGLEEAYGASACAGSAADVEAFLCQLSQAGILSDGEAEEQAAAAAQQPEASAAVLTGGVYRPPELFFESYQLSQHIAACGWDATFDVERDLKCKASYDPFFDNSQNYGYLFDRSRACEWVAGENIWDYCYTTGASDTAKLFSS